MNSSAPSQDPVVTTVLHDPAEDAAHHAEEHLHDPAEEIAHAKKHAVQNIWFFVGFFSLILCAVANYEFFGTTNIWAILGLAAARSALIAGFFVWLIGSFSLVVRTLVFTVIFFAGMIFLSMWDSSLKNFGDPIKDRVNGSLQSHVP